MPVAASARCIGSTDPLVQRMELETGRDPVAAIGQITEEINDTGPADRRRLAELYMAKSQAVYMSGGLNTPLLDEARKIGGAFGPADNLGLFLRLSNVAAKIEQPGAEKALQSIARDVEALPNGSAAKTCRLTDLAFYTSLLEQQREAMMFATQAYRNAEADRDSFERSQAASILAFLVSGGLDFDYANKLHSEAYAIQQDLGLSDLASNEMLLRGYTKLDQGDWKGALADFEESAREARSYDNQYAVNYALLGVCEAALEGKKTARAATACEAAYDGLDLPGERVAFTATTLMAQLLVEQGEPARALELLDPLVAEGKGTAASDIWITALEVRARALSLLGRNAQAYAAMREANVDAKEHYNRELQSGVAAMQARFQTEELQRQLAAEERASNARLRLAIAVMVGSVTTLGLLVALIFSLLRHRRRLRRLAMTDPLTGLANRRATMERVDEALRMVGMARPRACVALLDIDHFKSCNDRFGHDAGDLVLSEFARLVEDGVRPTDIVGRWGGEEFLVIFPATDASQAARIIDRVRTRAAEEEFDFARDYQLNFSAGIAMLEETGDRIDDCIKLADRRLYAAKALGRDRTCAGGHGGNVGSLGTQEPQTELPERPSAAEAA